MKKKTKQNKTVERNNWGKEKQYKYTQKTGHILMVQINLDI